MSMSDRYHRHFSPIRQTLERQMVEFHHIFRPIYESLLESKLQRVEHD